MAYQVLYRTYRPQKFSEVVGQEYVIKTLKNAIKNKRIAHAYLFAGPRGTGKTTVAKLFAKAINCEDFIDETCEKCDSCMSYNEGQHPDIIEMDAASNNSVEDIRNIVEEVPYAPILGKYKVYIIDEVHMLSNNAFNALLKTLEEPPSHVIFILATTDPQKILSTVLSRCQRYNFFKISKENIINRIKEVMDQEDLSYEEEAIKEIAVMAEGGMRDALSLCEQVLSYNPEGIFAEDVEKIFGLSSLDRQVRLLKLAHEGDIQNSISLLKEMYYAGIDMKRLATDLLELLKDTVIFYDSGSNELLEKITAAQAVELKEGCDIQRLLSDVEEIQNVLKDSRNQNILSAFEFALLKICSYENKVQIKKETIIKTEEKPAEEVKKEIAPAPLKKEDISLDQGLLLQIILRANKDLKVADSIIYNKLELFKYEPDKRRFYELLNNTEIFACSSDAIVVYGTSAQAHNINDKVNNVDLYAFLNKEFGIDKMIYAIDEDDRKLLIKNYKESDKQPDPDFKIIRYEVEAKKQTVEEKLLDMFDNVKIEE